ncbi:GDSL-type esterase/lipase family protein [Corynebacterium sp. MSK218]|uniref:GDSL-type esterase/lipase family protein n=1 Tax=Corynebacterium sp. MSK218 TaxID=3050218 RepID=UPI00254DE164|nr:GDSL-type esterase/lipase family protein [Corynebacterium sp. MSK218]MDK8762220.1 GDSL-type esterase/lipase family protein [Corynebacterium sp. MSK218]
MKSTQRLAALCATLLVAVGLSQAPQAAAAERNLVAFGDSVLADPQLDTYLSSRLGSSGRNPSLDCPSGNNFAKRTAAKLGMPVADFSCSGAVSMSQGPQMNAQVDDAIRRGKLTTETQRVIYAGGFNDTYNNAGLSDKDMRARFVGANAPIIHKIRAAAPNARIQIVGYPTIGSGDRYCLIHVGPKPADATALPMVQRYENVTQWMQVDLAHATGTEFVDMKPMTWDRGMCADANKRLWAGLVDFSAGPGNLPLHVNARGHEFVANHLASF